MELLQWNACGTLPGSNWRVWKELCYFNYYCCCKLGKDNMVTKALITIVGFMINVIVIE